jgi:hypothetical protein
VAAIAEDVDAKNRLAVDAGGSRDRRRRDDGFAAFAYAALRLTPLRRRPAVEGIHLRWGNLIVAKGESQLSPNRRTVRRASRVPDAWHELRGEAGIARPRRDEGAIES